MTDADVTLVTPALRPAAARPTSTGRSTRYNARSAPPSTAISEPVR
jgi:hypothetical protein